MLGWDRGWLIGELEQSRQRIGEGYRAGQEQAHRTAYFKHRSGPAGETRWLFEFGAMTSAWNRWGFVFRWGTFKQPTPFTNLNYAYRVVSVPCWSVVAAALICPAFTLRRQRQHRKRQAKRLCLVCGYDMRATPERCPECGELPAQTPRQSA